jgi:hypothetical protein
MLFVDMWSEVRELGNTMKLKILIEVISSLLF